MADPNKYSSCGFPAPSSLNSFSEFQPGHFEGGAERGSTTQVPPKGSPRMRTSSAARLGSLPSVPVGGYLGDGLTTGAQRALAEVHAPLGGTRQLLYALVAQGFFLGHCWSRSWTGADTGPPPWQSRRLCVVCAGGMWRARRAAVAW